MKDNVISKWFKEVKESMIEVLRNNGFLFTAFAVVLILISGVSIVENPNNWWISALAIITFFGTIFLFINARVILKCIVSSALTILLASFAFTTGSFIDPYNPGGIVWMLSTLFLFFATLAYSYSTVSGKSRWGTIAITQIVFFASTYVLSAGLQRVELASVLSLLISGGLFVLVYRFSKSSRASKKNMPENVLTEDFEKLIEKAASNNGMNFISLRDEETDRGGVIVWKEKAFLLYPVDILTAFVPIGRKMKTLGYRDKNINPWLINLAFKETPIWQSRGAEIMPVLVDLKNRNGHEFKTIGASLPDTKKKLPVGVFPGKIFKDENIEKIQKALSNIEIEYEEFVSPLSDKQKKALGRMSITEEVEEVKEEVNTKDV